MRQGLHHFHRRKRIHQKHEPYPHPNKWKRLMDKVIYVVVIVGVLMNIPQVAKIWIGQNATGVSVISWGAFFIISIFWLIYGIMHKEKPIILSSIGVMFFQALVVIGTLIYG